MRADRNEIGVVSRVGEEIYAAALREDARGRIRKPASASLTAIAAAVLAVSFAFTPPGRAIAGELGELVGIGESPSEDPDRNAVVIDRGVQAPQYEIVAERDVKRGGGTTCVGLEFPGTPGPQGASCLTPAVEQILGADAVDPIPYGAPAALYPDFEMVLQGFAADNVRRVVVHYRDVDGVDHQLEADVSSLTPDLAAGIGSDADTGFFVAFLPPTILAPPAMPGGPLMEENVAQAISDIRVVALGADDEELANVGLDDVDRQSLQYTPPPARFATGAARATGRTGEASP